MCVVKLVVPINRRSLLIKLAHGLGLQIPVYDSYEITSLELRSKRLKATYSGNSSSDVQRTTDENMLYVSIRYH